jgi:hypothetical protein
MPPGFEKKTFFFNIRHTFRHSRRSTPGMPDGLFSNKKIPIWVNFGVPGNGKCWYSLWPFGKYYIQTFGIFL